MNNYSYDTYPGYTSYDNYSQPYQNYGQYGQHGSSNDRIFGGGFFAPFLLGAATAPFLFRPRPFYPPFYYPRPFPYYW